ncbi:hypothetical protein CYY_004643 [Polysphondylium violaceum]|uniref:Uncharacterized protein n=1 Tax=Polysphondylium violaceum TaxID=133409 RepID=A0A8J4PWI9_9MYCE|nr:hypothetical protein CYY_004643 [Polysphondylium violaceum]
MMRVLVIFIPKSLPNRCIHFKKLGLWIIFQTQTKDDQQENNNNINNENIETQEINHDHYTEEEIRNNPSSFYDSPSTSNSSFSSTSSISSFSSSTSSNSNLNTPPIEFTPTATSASTSSTTNNTTASSSTNKSFKKRSWRIRTPSPRPKVVNTNYVNSSELNIQLPPTPTYPRKPSYITSSSTSSSCSSLNGTSSNSSTSSLSSNKSFRSRYNQSPIGSTMITNTKDNYICNEQSNNGQQQLNFTERINTSSILSKPCPIKPNPNPQQSQQPKHNSNWSFSPKKLFRSNSQQICRDMPEQSCYQTFVDNEIY